MKAGSLTRLAAVAALLAILIVLPGQAEAVGAPTVSVNSVSADEGQPASFTITRSGTPEDLLVPSTVAATTSNGTAVAPDDYASTTETFVFASGEETKTFLVPTVDDDIDEDNEDFKVTLTSVENATIPTPEGTGTIVDGDATPTLAISGAPSVTEGAPAEFTVSITGKSENAVTVNYGPENLEATEGSDYTLAAVNTLTWPSGDTTPRTITVATIDDPLDEADTERFKVNLSSPNGAIITTGTATGTIADNDAPPSATIGNAQVEPDRDGITEGATARFPVNLSAASGREVRVTYRTVDGSPPAGAVAPGDYSPKPSGSTLLIPAGQTSAVIEVATLDDAAVEADETFKVVLGDPNETVTIGSPSEGAAKILDNEPLSALSIVGGEVLEGDSATALLNYTVKLSAPSARTVQVTATTSDGTAVNPADYESKTQRLEFAPGQTEKVFAVTVRGDVLDEISETVMVTLTDPVAATLSTPSATGTITNDDNTSKLEIGDGSVDEPSTGTATLKLNVTLSPASARAVSVGWSTADGTASAGSDYTASSGTLDFAPGETSKEIVISVTGDTVNEENETVLINLASASGAGVADAQGEGTIIDKNAPPSLSIDDVLTREGETATFTITLSGNTLRTVTVVAKTIEGTAKEGTEYHARRTLFTFAPGEKSKTFQVPGIDDTVSEGIELYYVGLEDATNAKVTKSRGTATIDASDTVAKVASPPLRPTVQPPATAKRVLLPKMLLGPRTVVVNAGIARMLVTCAKSSPLACAGSVSFERVAKPKLVLGTKTFSVKPGKKGYAAIRLTAPALKLLAQKKTMPARAVVIVKTSARDLSVAPGVVTLKQGKPAQVRTVSVNAGVARMLVACAKSSPLPCAGSVSFERVAKPKLVLGTGSFSVKPGTKGYVAIRLTPPALKLLAQKKTMPARAVVIVKTSAKYLTFAPGPVTLKHGTPATKPSTAPTEVTVDP